MPSSHLSEGAPSRLLALAPLLAFVFTGIVVLLRIHRTGLQYYGMGAEYAEHGQRLGELLSWRASDASLFARILQVDSTYPPLLHLVTNAFAWLTGQGFVAIAALLWFPLRWLRLRASMDVSQHSSCPIA